MTFFNKQTGLGLRALLFLFLLGGLAQADDIWKKKPSSEWSGKEAAQILKKSPWAKEQRVTHHGQFTGVETRTTVIVGSMPPGDRDITRPDAVTRREVVAWYLVRWESAHVVRKAIARLDELEEFQQTQELSLSPQRPDDRYVITVVTTSPPFSYPGILDRQTAEGLKEKASLKVGRVTVHPLEVELGGTARKPAAHFFFPRTYRNKPLLPSQAGKVEFRLRANYFYLRAGFKLPPESVE